MSNSVKGSGASKGGSLFAGIVLGMLMGILGAGGVAWYILKKNPASFEDKEHHDPRPVAKAEPLPPLAEKVSSALAGFVPASAVNEVKQHFEFYKVLTDKPDSGAQKSAKKAVAPPSKPVHATNEKYYLQVGSFPNEGDAEKLKAKLAFLGMMAVLQSADIPNKGMYHRVRLGPIKGGDALKKVIALLKKNGVNNATPIKVK